MKINQMELSWAERLSNADRKHFQLLAYASTWTACFSDVALENSAIIILYLILLKANNNLIMLSTGLVGIVSMVLLIPSSLIVDRLGAKMVIKISSIIAGFSYLLIAFAPWISNEHAIYIIMIGIFFFSLSKPLCNAAWYPILSQILLPKERSNFFGTMRFSYYSITGVTFFLLGIFMGRNPPIVLLQVAIGIIGILAFLRDYFIKKIQLPEVKIHHRNIKEEFIISIKNSTLIGLSTYISFMCLTFAAILPLTLLYLKKGLHYPDNNIQVISAIGIFGCIVGCFLYSKLISICGIKKIQILIHLFFILIPLILFMYSANGKYSIYILGGLFFLGNIAFVCFNCAFSQELLAVAKPENTIMATALGQTYQMFGTAISRTISSLMLSNGILAISWKFLDKKITNFQTIFFLSSCIGIFCFILILLVPSVVSVHEDYYRP